MQLPETVDVLIWLPGATELVLAGEIRREWRCLSFTYDRAYLTQGKAISICARDLKMKFQRHYPQQPHVLAPALRVSLPDRWGRRALAAILSDAEGRPILEDEIDEMQVMLLTGPDRIGALEFRAPGGQLPDTPCSASLEELAALADCIEEGQQIPPSLAHLVPACASVGGARPKALFTDVASQYKLDRLAFTETYEQVKSLILREDEFLNWQSSFVGREDDLKVLQSVYDEVRSGTPRVVAVVAESGFGKTRLAQEFFDWLSVTHDGVEATAYWPNRLLRKVDNLQVNPDLDECGVNGTRMPFLWWGLRIADPGQRNVATSSGALPAGIETLRAHLETYAQEIRKEKLKKDQIHRGGRSAVDIMAGVGETLLDSVGNVSTFGLLSLGKALGELALKHRKVSKELSSLNDIDVRPMAAAGRARDTLAETVVGDLFHLCKAPPKDFNPIPIIIVVDDSQWLEADRGMGSFLDILLGRAREESWPLMVVLTSWSREWLASADAGRAPGKLACVSSGDKVLDLGGVNGLEIVIRKAFSGLADSQVAALADKAEGVPRLLDEMLSYLGV